MDSTRHTERLVVADERRPAVASRTLPRPASPEGLTAAELDVAGLLARGLSDVAVAHVIGIETATVERHRQRILEYFRIQGRGEPSRP